MATKRKPTEHKILILAEATDVVEAQLNALATEGWEITPISVSIATYGIVFTGFAKR